MDLMSPEYFGAFGCFRLGSWCTGRAFFPASWGGADGELLRLSDKQSYVVSTATLRGTRPRMDAPIPLWRTGVHALATDHGCKAKATGQSSLLCNAFVIVLKTSDSARHGSGLSLGSYRQLVINRGYAQ